MYDLMINAGIPKEDAQILQNMYAEEAKPRGMTNSSVYMRSRKEWNAYNKNKKILAKIGMLQPANPGENFNPDIAYPDAEVNVTRDFHPEQFQAGMMSNLANKSYPQMGNYGKESSILNKRYLGNVEPMEII